MDILTKSDCLPIPDDFTGKVMVLSAECLGARWQRAKFQLVKCTGGFGCYAGKIGRKVYGECLGDGEEAHWQRYDFIGEADEKTVEMALADPEGALPVDLTATCCMAIANGYWSKAPTVEEAKKALKKHSGYNAVMVIKCHPETNVDGWGYMTYPTGAIEPETLWEKKTRAKKKAA